MRQPKQSQTLISVNDGDDVESFQIKETITCKSGYNQKFVQGSSEEWNLKSEMSLNLIRSRVQASVLTSAHRSLAIFKQIVTVIKSHETALETDKTYQIVH